MASSRDYIPHTNRNKTAERILEAAITRLAQQGYAATSIGSIAGDLGISKGVVHYHFPSKEMLFQETIAYIYETAFADVRPGIDQALDDWGRVEQFIRGSIGFHMQRQLYVRALGELVVNFKPTTHRSYAAQRLEQELADVAALISDGQKHGAFADFDPVIMAQTLRQALNGAITAQAIPGYDMQHHTDELVKLFRRAIIQK